jgi:hypothetical protein
MPSITYSDGNSFYNDMDQSGSNTYQINVTTPDHQSPGEIITRHSPFAFPSTNVPLTQAPIKRTGVLVSWLIARADGGRHVNGCLLPR